MIKNAGYLQLVMNGYMDGWMVALMSLPLDLTVPQFSGDLGWDGMGLGQGVWNRNAVFCYAMLCYAMLYYSL